MGDELYGPGSGNVKGHYEDVQIIDFHVSILKRQFGEAHKNLPPRKPAISEADIAAARNLARQREAKQHPWGWKEPRTCLFLPLWRDILPHARFVFVYRNPTLVVDSYARRQKLRRRQVGHVLRIINAWNLFNEAICDFCEQSDVKYILFNVDTAVQSPAAFAKLLSRFVSLPITEHTVIAPYDKSLLTQQPKTFAIYAGLIRVKTSPIYNRLRALTSLPSSST